MKSPIAIVAAAVAALALAGAALADQWQIHRTPGGNAAARAAVLSRSDLGSAAGWTGGIKAPDLSSTPSCGGFHPKQSDLVVVGAAASHFRHQGLDLDSQANVLATTQMVRLDWQRTVVDPRVTPCLRAAIAKGLGSGTTLLTFGVIAFPHLTAMTRCYRAVVQTGSVKVFIDVVAIGKGRTELSLTTISPLAADAAVRAAEHRLAAKLVSRART